MARLYFSWFCLELQVASAVSKADASSDSALLLQVVRSA
jgi:hypothetical protein